MGRAGRLSVHTLGTCPRCEGRNHSFLHASRISVTESDRLRLLSLTFLTRSGCHLCEEAERNLDWAAAKLRIKVDRVDIDGDDALVKQWGLRIPVVLAEREIVAEGIIDDRRVLRDQIRRVLRI